MKRITITSLEKPILKTVTIPGSLSYTIRALNLAVLTRGTVILKNALKSDDTYTMVTILQKLGIKAEETYTGFIIHSSIEDVQEDNYELNINISGRTARTTLATLCLVPGIKILTCKEEFKKRPVKDLVDGLRQLGADIEYLENEGYLPVKINSSTLHSGTISMNGSVSSQYFSAIMMIAPLIGEVIINVVGEQASKPFIDITIDTMKEFGVEVINENYKRYIVKANQQYKMKEYSIEADVTSASYFLGIAALTRSTIRIPNISPSSPQGDVLFVDLLELMGCSIVKNEKDKWVEVTGKNNLKGVSVDMNHMPDVVPTLAVLAAFAEGITHITGISHLKIKESDRIEAPKQELFKMGIRVESTDDSLTIYGGKPHGAEIETHGDHRIAMSFAMAGTRINGMVINNPEVVNKSFPNFWDKLEELGVETRYEL